MLRPGMLADLVLLNADLFVVPEGDIAQVQPILTMVNGRPVFREIVARASTVLDRPLPYPQDCRHNSADLSVRFIPKNGDSLCI
ncbi:MAG: hypothetical protein IPK16_04670 [Anaerolineales bacterium]|nr:hypothetical protein [Anaerolineales bacterium]